MCKETICTRSLLTHSTSNVTCDELPAVCASCQSHTTNSLNRGPNQSPPTFFSALYKKEPEDLSQVTTKCIVSSQKSFFAVGILYTTSVEKTQTGRPLPRAATLHQVSSHGTYFVANTQSLCFLLQMNYYMTLPSLIAKNWHSAILIFLPFFLSTLILSSILDLSMVVGCG